MATRQESVRLELVDEFTTPMARAAAATALLNAQLDRLNGTAVGSRNTQNSQTIVRNTDSMGQSSERAGASIDRLSGRLSLLAQTASVLGPALIPIGAVAIPAVAGLANQLAAAGLAGGTLILAMNGVADATKAIDAYRLDPTVANLEKAREALKGLSPEARGFVSAFQDFQPVLKDLRDAAAEGWMPGLTEALDNLERAAPRVEAMILAISEAGGGAVADITDSLAGDRWAGFIAFLTDEMPSTLLTVTDTVGALAHGLAELWMAFDPLNDDFSSWLVNSARDFDNWAQGLEQTEGFQDFIDYIRENGPQVERTLGAFATAAIDFVQAAAPLGGPVLEALEVVAEAISAVAESPIGPKIATMAAAFVILNKTLAITAGLMARLGFAGAAGALRGGPAVGGGAVAAGPASRFGGMVAGLTAVTSAQDRATTSAGQLTAAQQRQRAAMSQLGRGMAVGAAGAVAFAVASGRMGDGLQLSNTAMLGLVGSMTGPWGAAIGGGLGLMLDFRDHTNDVEKAQANLNTVLQTSTSTYGSVVAAQQQVTEAQRKYFDSLTGSTSDLASFLAKDPLEAWKLGFDALDGHVDSLEAMGTATKTLSTDSAVLGRTFLEIGRALGDKTPITAGDLISPDVERVEGIINQVQPAMQRLGVTMADLAAMSPGELSAFVDQVVQLTAAADTPVGRLQNLTDVITNNGEVMLTASGRADAFRVAMSALVDPALNMEAALSQQRDVLKQIKDLDVNGGFTVKNAVGRENLAITRDYTAAVKERLATMIAAGRSEESVAKVLARSREQFIQSGVAAGFSAGEMRKRANAIGLTPKLVTTTFRALGIGAFEQQVNGIKNLTKGVPKKVLTDIATNGVPKTQAEIEALLGKYKLTEKQRTAVLALIDRASGQIPAALAALARYDGKSATSYLYTRKITILETRGAGAYGRGAQPAAEGATVPKTGLPYADRHLYMLADGEEIISNRHGQADRFRADRAAGRIPGYALGGEIGQRPGATVSFGPVNLEGPAGAANALAAAMLRLSRLSAKELNLRERHLNQEIRRQEKQIRLDEREVRRDERAFEREKRETQVLKDRVEVLRQERDAIRDTISARLKSQLFSGESPGAFDPNAFSIGGKPEGFDEMTSDQQQAAIARERRFFDQMQASIAEANDPLRTLQADVDRAAEMFRLSNILGSRGLDGDALTELMSTASIEQIRDFANGDQSRLDQYESLFNLRASTTNKAGLAVAGAEGVAGELRAAQVVYEAQLIVQRAFAADLKMSNAELREHTKELRELNRRQDRIEKAIDIKENQRERAADRRADKQSKDTGKAVGDAVNNAATAGGKGRTAR